MLIYVHTNTHTHSSPWVKLHFKKSFGGKAGGVDVALAELAGLFGGGGGVGGLWEGRVFIPGHCPVPCVLMWS